jgi:hypothetical protein
MSVISYDNISIVKVGEFSDGNGKFVPSMQIYFKNGDSLFAVFKKKYFKHEVFDSGFTIEEHNDTDYWWDNKPVDTKGIDKLLSMCGKYQYIQGYNA